MGIRSMDEVAKDIEEKGEVKVSPNSVDGSTYEKWLYDEPIPPQPRPLIEIVEEKAKYMVKEELLLKYYPNFDALNKTCTCDEECNHCPCDECGDVDRRFFNCAEDCLIGKYCTKKPKSYNK